VQVLVGLIRRSNPFVLVKFHGEPFVKRHRLDWVGEINSITIMRQFLHWLRTASPRARAEASGALARAYLCCDLSPGDRIAAENAMIALLDDPSPLVRRALAEALAASLDAPRAVIYALASDHRDIAAPVLARSPLLIDAELVDFVATCDGALQAVIATRTPLAGAVAAAIAEVGSAEACLVAVENPCADVDPASLARIVERFGHLGAIREALFARPDLPLAARQSLVRQLSSALIELVAERNWLPRDRVEEIGQEACEKATVTIAAHQPNDDVRSLVRHLRASGQLTEDLMLRALLSGLTAMFERALAELADLPLRRLQALVRKGGDAGLRAVFDRAGLPPSTYVAFREASTAAREERDEPSPSPPPLAMEKMGRLKRHVVERALMRCKRSDIGDLHPLMILLRRFATEAAREDARLSCERLLAEDPSADEVAAA
jgi:uncharacterized protein (DUF2336 family)